MKVEASLVTLSLILFQSPLVISTSTKRQLLEPDATRVVKHLVDDFPEVHDAIIMARSSEEETLENHEEEGHGASLLHHHRKLQLSGACNTTYAEFWENNQALREAYTYYKYSRTQAIEAVSAAGDVCTENAFGDLVCDYDEPIFGTTQFRSACTTAGGKVVSLSLDVTCILYLVVGDSLTATFDEPPLFDCIPGTNFDSCENEFGQLVDAFTDEGVALIESGLAEADGVSSVSCQSTGGSNDFTIEDNDESSTAEESGVSDNIDPGSSTQDNDAGDNDGLSTQEEDEVEINESGSRKASTQGTCWFFASVAMTCVSLLFR